MRVLSRYLRETIQGFDWRIVFPLLLLLGFGLLMVFDASSATALKDFGDKYYFVRDQIKWVLLGIISMGVVSLVDYRKYYRLSPVFIVGSLILLALVFVPGIGIKAYGASRWLNLGFIVLQPSEITKLSLVIYLAAWFSSKESGRLLAFLMLVGLYLGLILLQPDMGTAMVVAATALGMYFASGAPLWHFGLIIPGALAGIGLLALKSSYRLKRVLSFINTESDPLGSSYHIRQSLIAIGSGGLFGLGFGNSRQKYSYLPEANTDSIIAIIAEEVGFVGICLLFAVFSYLIYRCFQVSLKTKNSFGRLLSAGITIWLASQLVINIGSMSALIPLTGVPLPFISYGGSAIVVEMAAIGIILNISRQNGNG